jgi:predicted SAM-dependent methyltransferase
MSKYPKWVAIVLCVLIAMTMMVCPMHPVHIYTKTSSSGPGHHIDRTVPVAHVTVPPISTTSPLPPQLTPVSPNAPAGSFLISTSSPQPLQLTTAFPNAPADSFTFPNDTHATIRSRYELHSKRALHGSSWPGVKFGTLRHCPRTFDDINTKYVRQLWANQFLHGNGIEIGALHSPMPMPSHAKVTYVDSMTHEEQRKHYPELSAHSLVHPQIISSAEELSPIPTSSLDFVVASHVLEHTDRVLLALSNFLRVLKPNGILFLAIPNKCFSFDRLRVVTSWQHLLDEFNHPLLVASHRKEHFREWSLSHHGGGTFPTENLDTLGAHFESKHYAIHFHTWDAQSITEFLLRAQTELKFPFRILASMAQAHEFVYVLSKNDEPEI